MTRERTSHCVGFPDFGFPSALALCTRIAHGAGKRGLAHGPGRHLDLGQRAGGPGACPLFRAQPMCGALWVRRLSDGRLDSSRALVDPDSPDDGGGVFSSAPPEGGSLRTPRWLSRRKRSDGPSPCLRGGSSSVPTRSLHSDPVFSREEKPVVIPDFDLPRPDFSVVRGSFREYATRHPTPEDVLLLIEISDSSLAKDRYK